MIAGMTKPARMAGLAIEAECDERRHEQTEELMEEGLMRLLILAT